MVEKSKRKIDVDKIENLTIKLIIFSATLIILGIIISVYQKNIAFWITSIGSAAIFFLIFVLIAVIFLKEFKTK